MRKFTSPFFKSPHKKFKQVLAFCVFFLISLFGYSQNFENVAVINVLSGNNTNKAVFTVASPTVPALARIKAEVVAGPGTGKFTQNGDNIRFTSTTTATGIPSNCARIRFTFLAADGVTKVALNDYRFVINDIDGPNNESLGTECNTAIRFTATSIPTNLIINSNPPLLNATGTVNESNGDPSRVMYEYNDVNVVEYTSCANNGFLKDFDMNYNDFLIATPLYKICLFDSDGDGIPNNVDIDDDNDGILDTVEGGGNNPDGDADGDGLPNYLDTENNAGQHPVYIANADGSTTNYTDANSDGVPDVYESSADGDGLVNHLDLDSDNDGIYDITESGQQDADNNGIVDVYIDANSNGVTDALDPFCAPMTVVTPVNFNGLSQTNTSVTNPDNALGASNTTIAAFDAVNDQINIRLGNGTNPVNIPNGTVVALRLSRVAAVAGLLGGTNGTTTFTVSQSVDGVTYTNGITFNPTTAITTFNYTTTVANVQFIRVTLTSRQNGTGGLGAANGVGNVESVTGTFNVTTISPNPCAVLGVAVVPLNSDGADTPNYLDLDSDNDGCTDANEYYGSLGGDGGDGGQFGVGDPAVNNNGAVIAANYIGMGNYAPVTNSANAIGCTIPDNDLDGVPDNTDLDDDNDGILDSIECTTETTNFAGIMTSNPSTSNNTSTSITVSLEAPMTAVNPAPDVYGANVASASFRYITYQFTNPVNDLTFKIFDIDQVEFVDVQIFDSQNNLIPLGARTYTLGANVLMSPANSNIFTGNTITPTFILLENQSLSVYVAGKVSRVRIGFRKSDGTSGNLGTSAFTYATDTDQDGVRNCFDTDSDGDGCPDAVEGGGTFTSANVNANGQLSGPVGANGVPLAAGMGQTIGTSQNPTMQDLACSPRLDPDFAVGFLGAPITGSLATNNNNFPTGTVYSNNPVPVGENNPSADLPTINPDGTYTFTSMIPGVYVFDIQVCEPNPSTTCITNTLTITVNDPASTNNPPAANPDLATTVAGMPVVFNTLGNDASGTNSAPLNPASVMIVPGKGPANGTVTVDPVTGNITYTPNPGFTGVDIYYYTVCDNAMPPRCTESYQEVTVAPAGTNVTSASDDFMAVPYNTTISGNVLANDFDPQGNTLTISNPGTYSVAGGTLTLNADGTYSFAPTPGFSGPVSYTYSVCDNGTPQACDNATLSFLVAPQAVLPVDFVLVNAKATNNCKVNVTWSTGTELNISRFVVEQSTNGTNFKAISTTLPKGSGSNYSILVDGLSGVQFYRIRSIDLDNSFELSSIVKVEGGCDNNGIKIFPNPTTDRVNIENVGGNDKVQIALYNATGSLVLSKVFASNSVITLNIKSLPKGVYTVKAISGSTTKVEKLIKL